MSLWGRPHGITRNARIAGRKTHQQISRTRKVVGEVVRARGCWRSSSRAPIQKRAEITPTVPAAKCDHEYLSGRLGAAFVNRHASSVPAISSLTARRKTGNAYSTIYLRLGSLRAAMTGWVMRSAISSSAVASIHAEPTALLLPERNAAVRPALDLVRPVPSEAVGSHDSYDARPSDGLPLNDARSPALGVSRCARMRRVRCGTGRGDSSSRSWRAESVPAFKSSTRPVRNTLDCDDPRTGILLLSAILLLLIGCSGSPTGVDFDSGIQTSGGQFIIYPYTYGQVLEWHVQTAESGWSAVSSCLGVPTRPRGIPIMLLQGGSSACGNSDWQGCFDGQHVEIIGASFDFDPANPRATPNSTAELARLWRHEFVHVGLFVRDGDLDANHQSSEWYCEKKAVRE